MEKHLDALNAMMATWNTTDESEIRRLTEEALEHNVHFVDPNHNIIGREAFVDMVLSTQKQIPGAAYSHNSTIEMQNNFCRYHWKIDMGEKRLMDGFDVVEVSDSGKILKVIGFFGSLKAES